MKLEITVPEVLSIFKEIQQKPERIFEIIRSEVNESVGEYLTKLMQVELTAFLGREKYEHGKGDLNYRNGSYGRKFTLKRIGEVDIEIPRDRQGKYKTEVIPRSKRYEEEIRQDLSFMFLTGISTRTLSMMSKRLVGRKVSPTEVSNANNSLIDAVEKWRTRDLSEERIKYIFADGVNFDMRIGRSIEKVPVLAVIGVSEKGNKKVLGFQSGDKESSSSWREFFKDLKGRGLEGSTVILGIMDGLPGLEKVFREEFINAKVQRCQIHVDKNVLAKVPRKLKKEVAGDIRSIFYASSKKKAMEFFAIFKNRWQKDLPSAVKCLENSLESCLTYYMCPEEEWISLRTTNIIERLNKEFKRRTKSMEIVAGESSCYTLLAFISLKMELNWRSNPVGKVPKNLPFFKELENNEFTQ